MSAMATVAAAQVQMREQGGVVLESARSHAALGRRVHRARVRQRRVRTRRAAGGGVPPSVEDARHRAARRAGPVQLPAGRHPPVADRPGRCRRAELHRRNRRAHRGIPADRELQSARLAVRDRRYGARPGSVGGRGRAASRNQWREAVFILVPGIDVPFHSSVLRVGVPSSGARWSGSCRATHPR